MNPSNPATGDDAFPAMNPSNPASAMTIPNQGVIGAPSLTFPHDANEHLLAEPNHPHMPLTCAVMGEDPIHAGESSSPSQSSAKRLRSSASPSSADMASGKQRKWSDPAVDLLVDTYTEIYVVLKGRNNLSDRDWEGLAVNVSKNLPSNQPKTVTQCRKKLDKMKSAYKRECDDLSGVWHSKWFAKMAHIVDTSSSYTMRQPSSSSSPIMQTGEIVISPSSSPIMQPRMVFKRVQPRMVFKRVLLKISSSALGGDQQKVNTPIFVMIANQVARSKEVAGDIQVAILVGYKNYFLGETWMDSIGNDTSTQCQMAILASTMNSVVLQAALEEQSVKTRLLTMQNIADPGKAIRQLDNGNIIIFGGTASGNLLITADEAAVLRACEINAQAVFIGMKTEDYRSRCKDCLFRRLSFRDCLANSEFTAMDRKALANCQQYNIPVFLFDFIARDSISRALGGDLTIGTLIDW